MPDLPAPKRPHTSRQRYAEFVDDYRHRRLDELTDARSGRARQESDETARKTKRREFIREYLRWLKPRGVYYEMVLRQMEHDARGASDAAWDISDPGSTASAGRLSEN